MARFSEQEREFFQKLMEEQDETPTDDADTDDEEDDTEIIVVRGAKGRSFLQDLFGSEAPANETAVPVTPTPPSKKVPRKKTTPEPLPQDGAPPSSHRYFS